MLSSTSPIAASEAPFRLSNQRWRFAAAYACILPFELMVVARGAGSPATRLVVLVLWGLVGLLVVTLGGRAGVGVSSAGLRLRYPLHTVSVPWDQVRGFAQGPYIWSNRAVYVLTPRGRHRLPGVFQGMNVAAPGGVTRDAKKRLEELREAHSPEGY